jgi:hypothetical protein
LTDFNAKKAFLREAKQLISMGEKDFIKRTYDHPNGKKINWKEALLEIGLTSPNQVWEEALKLTPTDYVDGPCIDIDRPKDGKVIWIFKKKVNGVLTYIKMKIDHRGCVCLSFHEDW